MAIKENSKSLDLLPEELCRRFFAPLKSVTFWVHLIVGVIGFGGVGVWYALIGCKTSGDWNFTLIAAALCTYFPAVAGAAYVDSNGEFQPYFRSFGLLAAAVFIVIFVFAAFGVREGGLLWGIIGSVLSVLFWWVINADKECFNDVTGDGATPSPDRELKGDDNGWKTK